MKISSKVKSQSEVNINRQATLENQSFQRLVQSQSQNIKHQELEQLIKNISLQGPKTCAFLGHYVNSLNLSE